MTSLPISLNPSALTSFYGNLKKRRCCFRLKFLEPVNSYPFSIRKCCSYHENEFDSKAFNGGWSSVGLRSERYGILVGKDRRKNGSKRRVVKVRLNQFGLNGGGNGGGRDDGNNARVLGNLALAVGLTYLTMTGQLGWLLDTIVSIGLLAIILPFAGLAAFTWWAGQNIVQSSCPNCGKEVQIFKSSLNDGLQLCPYCTQPFSVEGNEFIREPPGNFTSNQSSPFGEAFNGFSSSSKKEKASSLPVVDIEAEVTDVE